MDEDTPLLGSKKITGYGAKRQLGKFFENQCSLPPTRISSCITIVLIFALLYALLYLLFGDYLLPPNAVFGFLCLIAVAYVIGLIFELVRLPGLLGMLLTGVVARTTGLITLASGSENTLGIARNIALTVILIRAGLGLDPSALYRLKTAVLKLALLPCLGESLAVALVAKFALGMSWLWGFMIGFILSPISPAVVVPTLLKLKEGGYGEDKGIATMVLAASSIDDVTSISLFGIMYSKIFDSSSSENLAMAILSGPLEIICGILIGTIWGFLCAVLPHRSSKHLTMQRGALLGFGGVVAVLGSSQIGFSGAGPLAAVSSALVANIAWSLQGWSSDEPHPVTKLFSFFWLFLEPLLFASIGAEINLRSLPLSAVVDSVEILLAGLAFRIVTCSLCLIGMGLTTKEKIFVNLAWLPKATVQAALGPLPLEGAINSGNPQDIAFATTALTVAVLSILITAPIGSLSIRFAGPKFLTSNKNKVEVASAPIELEANTS